MTDVTLKQVISDDRRFRLSIIRSDDGLIFYRNDSYSAWDDTPNPWQDGPPSDERFATAQEAEADARERLPWLRNSK
jgi:hypothetical protein